MRSSAESSADQHLRETLLAHHGGSNSHSPLQRIEAQQPHNSVHNLDPAIAGSGMMNRNAGDSGADDNNSDGKKGKRELSTSKRAAQNRQAQRAFRQRKEGHIKHLEAQVKDYNSLSESYKTLQAENYQLRDYIISLQSRLIESQGEFPQPPSNIDISPQRPSATAHSRELLGAPTATMASSAVRELQASAAQVIDLSSGKHEDEVGSPASKRPRIDPRSESNAGSPGQPPPRSIVEAEGGGAPR
ncbi:MAG: hypothetical protein LQ350_002774 [Teloschistes chrysophthalmus]|nr:MAG: hypothetical protein LQ350_002774 [Niorma chrysophthalma]